MNKITTIAEAGEEVSASVDIDNQAASIKNGIRMLLLAAIGAAFSEGCVTKLDVRLKRGTVSLEEIKAMNQLYNGNTGLSDLERAVKPTRDVVFDFNNMTIRYEDIVNILNRRFPDGWDEESLQVRHEGVGDKAITEVLYRGDCIIQISKTDKNLINLRVFDNKILYGETENFVFNGTTEQIMHQSACVGDPFGGKLCYIEGSGNGDIQKTSSYQIKLPVVGWFIEDYCVREDDGELMACPRLTYRNQ